MNKNAINGIFYAGLCGQDYNYCAQQGYHTETRMDGQDPFASRYTVCVSPESQMLGLVAQLSNLNARVVITDTEACPEVDTSSHPPAPISQDMTSTAPSSFDWRNHLGYNWLTGVKDQDCGDCWAFAAIGVTEAHHNIVADNPGLDLNLAEQNLVSCSDAGSCSGGSSYLALRYIQSNGIVDENCFPYMGADSSCVLCSGWQNRLTYVDEVYGFVPNRDTIRQSVVDYGPMYVSMGVNLDYGGYWDGNNIYRCSNDSQNGHTGSNHAVVIVGYNDAGGYWIVRNSWGSGWNSDGYFKVGYDECNIDRTYASYTYLVPPTQASGVRPDGWTGPYTNDSTPRFQWYAASDSGSGMAGYYVAVDDWTPEGGFDNDWWVGNVTAYTVPEAQSDGQHIFAVTSKDRFGNINPNNTNQQGDAPYYTFYVDTHAPSSAVSALAVKQQQMKFTVKWSGSDVTSGVANYDVQYRLGTSGTWMTWISASSATSAVFQAQQEGTYYFRSRARDRAGNVENWPSGNGDAYTYVPMIKVYLPLLLRNYRNWPPIPATPALHAIDNADGDGTYTVNWGEATLADTYILQEDDNTAFSSPQEVYNSSGLSWTAMGKSAGTYYYRVKAHNSWGDSGWSTVQAAFVAPDTFYAVEDASALQGAPNLNDGSDLTMWVGYDHCPDSINGVNRGLVKFDVSSIPAGMPIDSATLHLYLAGSCDLDNRTHTVTSYRITNNWTEGTVTWNTQPSIAEAHGSGTVASQSWGWYTLDVTGLVRGWANQHYPNYGLMLRGPEGSGNDSARLSFATSEASGYEPYITVNYGGVSMTSQPEQDASPPMLDFSNNVKGAPTCGSPGASGFVEMSWCAE